MRTGFGRGFPQHDPWLTKNVDAHDFFLRGRELVIGNKRDREMFAEANVYLRRAIELDPNYAGPYAALGWAYIMDYQNRWSDSPETSLDQAQRLIDEAVAKDDKDIVFETHVGKLVFNAKFAPKDMLYRGDLAV